MDETTLQRPLQRPCLTCKEPTEYQYLCEHCSELFLIEMNIEARKFGIEV